MFNAIRSIVIVAAALAVPAVSFAQSAPGLTRAQVRAELVQVEKAGYMPSADDSQYPQNIQNAEAKIAAEENGSTAKTSTSAMPPSAMTAPMPMPMPMPMSMSMSMSGGHRISASRLMPTACVGPIEFCNVYFGS